MKSSIKFFALSSLFIAFPVLAQEEAAAKDFSQILLTIAIVLGIISSIYVFVLSVKMGGGVIASTLMLYGIGMISVVVSLLSVTWLKTTMGSYAGIAHDLFFIVGFIFMVLGSHKLSGVIN